MTFYMLAMLIYFVELKLKEIILLWQYKVLTLC